MVKLTLCSAVQAPIQCVTRPSMWIPWVRNLHVHREKWTLEQTGSEFTDLVQSALSTLIENDKKGTFYDIQKIEPNFVRIFAFTWAEWLDIVEIEVTGNVAEVVSFSSGLLPLSIPFACLLNIAFFWVPFLGHGFNTRRLKDLRTAMGVSLVSQ